MYIDASIYKTFPVTSQFLVDKHTALLVSLRDLASKWKVVGDQLGVPVSELDAIHENNCGSLDMCGSWLQATFLLWREATVSKLARAVHEVSEHSAGEKISRQFGELDGCHSCSYIPGS